MLTFGTPPIRTDCGQSLLALTLARSCACHQSSVIPPVEAHPGTAFPGLVLEVGRLVEPLVVVNAEGKCRRRPHSRAAPAICGGKKRPPRSTIPERREAVDFRHLTRTAYPGIFELCHSMGKVIGVLPSTLKSKPLCVYFQIHSPEMTRYFPKPAPGHRGIRCESQRSKASS